MRRYIALALIAAVSACSTVKTVPPAPAEVCAQPGLWAVYAADTPTRAKSALPQPLPPGQAAAAGAWAGGAGSVKMGFGAAISVPQHKDDPIAPVLATAFLALGIAIAPVAAIVGAGVGAASAHSEAEIAAAKNNMTKALDSVKPADAIRARVVALSEERAGRRTYDCGDSGNLDTCRRQSSELVAVLLSITVSSPYFEVEGSISPDLRLLLSAKAEVIRSRDGVTEYQRAWVYRGRQHGYFDFAADAAKLFRAELDTAMAALAAKAVDDLLIGGREEIHSSSEQPEGTVWTVLPPAAGPGPGADCP